MAFVILDPKANTLSIGQGKHRVSWKNGRKGHFSARFAFDKDGSLHIELNEGYYNKKDKYKSRSVRVELNAPQVSAIRDFLSCKESIS